MSASTWRHRVNWHCIDTYYINVKSFREHVANMFICFNTSYSISRSGLCRKGGDTQSIVAANLFCFICFSCCRLIGRIVHVCTMLLSDSSIYVACDLSGSRANIIEGETRNALNFWNYGFWLFECFRLMCCDSSVQYSCETWPRRRSTPRQWRRHAKAGGNIIRKEHNVKSWFHFILLCELFQRKPSLELFRVHCIPV